MGSDTQTSSYVTMEIANNITQTSVASCKITCNQDQSNNTVIISPGANTGNISFTQSCVIEDASCMINQNIESTLENILQSTVDQTALSTQAIFSATYNSTKAVSDIDQIINNQVRQMISSTCTIESNQTMNNNYVYVGTGASTGDITFAQHSVLSNVECTMDITAKSSAYNQETSEVKQKATTINVIVMLFLLFAIIASLVAIILIVFLVTGGTKVIGDVANSAIQSQGGGGGMSSSSAISTLEANPELFLL